MHTHTLPEIVPPEPAPMEDRSLPAFGARVAVLRDQIYWFGTRGLIFTSPWVNTPRTRRQTAVLLLTVSGKPLELTWNGRRIRHDALAIAPLTQRGLRAIDIGLVSVNVQPGHPAFGALCRMTRDGVVPLSRAAYARFDTALLRAYEGRLPHRESERLFEALVETTVGELRANVEEDGRADRLHRLLARNPACTLEDVARELNVSYSGASHVFSRTIGLPLRSYQHWLKCMRAEEMFADDVRLTEIAEAAGFTDLPHLSRTWQRNFGMAPSYVRDSQHVRIVA